MAIRWSGIRKGLYFQGLFLTFMSGVNHFDVLLVSFIIQQMDLPNLPRILYFTFVHRAIPVVLLSSRAKMVVGSLVAS